MYEVPCRSRNDSNTAVSLKPTLAWVTAQENWELEAHYEQLAGNSKVSFSSDLVDLNLYSATRLVWLFKIIFFSLAGLMVHNWLVWEWLPTVSVYSWEGGAQWICSVLGTFWSYFESSTFGLRSFFQDGLEEIVSHQQFMVFFFFLPGLDVEVIPWSGCGYWFPYSSLCFLLLLACWLLCWFGVWNFFSLFSRVIWVEWLSQVGLGVGEGFLFY